MRKPIVTVVMKRPAKLPLKLRQQLAAWLQEQADTLLLWPETLNDTGNYTAVYYEDKR